MSRSGEASGGHRSQSVQRWQQAGSCLVTDELAEEVPVALVYNGISHVVMMATPLALEEFALGFSLSEGIILLPRQIYGMDVREGPDGIEVHIELASECFAHLKQQRRNLTGRTGCGLCGAESLQQLRSDPPAVVAADVPATAAIERALAELTQRQPLQAMTGAVHGAAWCDNHGQIQLLCEDIGRHNALDKLIGARAMTMGEQWAFSNGFVLISSRASYEMVSKCAAVGVATLVAVSAPTTMAVDYARKAGMNLIGFARPGRYVVYTEKRCLADVS